MTPKTKNYMFNKKLRKHMKRRVWKLSSAGHAWFRDLQYYEDRLVTQVRKALQESSVNEMRTA